jgi:tetratricopeptide (TPR) repeat protein
MKTIDFSYFIERYNASEMDQAEIKWFEKELSGNESLRKEVLLRRKADQMLVKHDLLSLRNKLSSIEKTRKEKLIETAGKRTLAIRYAAVFTGLVLIGSLFIITGNKQSPQELYNKNFSAYEFPGPSRTAQSQTDNQYSLALGYYADNHFADAGVLFREYLKNNSENMQATLLYGICEMENKDFSEAKASFNKIIQAKFNLFTDQAQWYLALCYIANGEKAEAKLQLAAIKKSESIYRNKARKILKNL